MATKQFCDGCGIDLSETLLGRVTGNAIPGTAFVLTITRQSDTFFEKDLCRKCYDKVTEKLDEVLSSLGRTDDPAQVRLFGEKSANSI
jgi:hypothetical protein